MKDLIKASKNLSINLDKYRAKQSADINEEPIDEI